MGALSVRRTSTLKPSPPESNRGLWSTRARLRSCLTCSGPSPDDEASAHAKVRMAEREIDADEVYNVVRRPEIDRAAFHHAGRRLLLGGRLVVVTERRIVTCTSAA
ncbi:MAG: DUF4258 domain-containing protein [Ilumatobacteraceae bacterium]